MHRRRLHAAGAQSRHRVATKLGLLPTFRARRETLFPRAPKAYVDMWGELAACVRGLPPLSPSQADSLYKQMVCHAWYGIESHVGGDTWDFQAWLVNVPWSTALDPRTQCENYGQVDRAGADFAGQIVQSTDDDGAAQKRAWLVDRTGVFRRHIPTTEIFGCLVRGGAHMAGPLPQQFLSLYMGAVSGDVDASACSAPRTAPQLAISGACTSVGGTLVGSTRGFTPGGTATIRAWYPDGRAYTNLVSSARVRADGSIPWTWPCAGDPPGGYTTEAVDDASGASTGRVAFAIGSSGTVPPPTPAQATLVVDNRVTNGGAAMREDTPAYLSTVTRNFCKRDGCALVGTDMGSGASVVAECSTFGDRTTNGQDNSTIDDANSGLYSSTRWYGIRWGDGRFGYLSEVWIRAADRGGKGLRAC